MKRSERRTLVLNASYEPMAVVSSRRALLLVLNEKASVLVESDRIVHSAVGKYAEPEVVLLRQFIRVPRRSVPMTRRAVLEMYDYTCAYCFKHGNTIDHVIPRARGGTNTWPARSSRSTGGEEKWGLGSADLRDVRHEADQAVSGGQGDVGIAESPSAATFRSWDQ